MGVVQSIGALLGCGLRVKASGSAETELCDLPHASRPATANTPDMLNRADAIIHADQHITT
jgi:hypothetical protein